MQGSAKNRFFLPLWRDGRLLFFTNYSEKATTRQNYIVAAATEIGQNVVARTQLSAVSPAELEKCQSIADSGVELQHFFEAVGSGNLETFTNQLDPDSPFFTTQDDRLIYICMHLDLLRKYIVDEKIIQNYEAATVIAPLNADVAHGILKTMTSRLQPERACAIFDRDFARYLEQPFSNLSAANFLRAGAMAKFEAGRLQEAEDIMLRAVKLNNTEDKWRRLAEIASANNKPDAAIGYYKTAHGLSALPASSALLMAKLLVKTKNLGEIEPYLEIVEKSYPTAARTIRKNMGGT